MSLPPNRLIDWLPLLLFACFTPALAAQLRSPRKIGLGSKRVLWSMNL